MAGWLPDWRIGVGVCVCGGPRWQWVGGLVAGDNDYLLTDNKHNNK